MKKALALLLSIAMVLALAACGGASSTPAASTPTESTPAADGSAAPAGDFADAPHITIQFAENQASNGPMGEYAEVFAKDLAERTGGTVEMSLYFDALLGDEATVIGMVEAGTVEFTRVNLAALQATDPEVGVLTMPYIYSDAIHCYNVMNSDVGTEILSHVSDYGMQGLRLFGGHPTEAGGALSRGFYSSTPINGLADLAGKKIRVQESDVVIAMVEALGGVATPMAYGEVFQALQTGVVDIAENDPMSYVMSGHYEVAKYYTMDQHQISPSIYLMSQKCYDAMTEAQREVFMECLDEYLANVTEATAQMVAEYRQQALDAGCEFIEVDTSEFQAACESVYEKYPEYADYITRIKAVSAEPQA